jgi:hypothetical protein
MPTRTGIRISGFPVEVTETADALTLESEGSRDLILDAGSGKVGIGTTDPAVALDVIGTASFAGAEASLSQGNVQVGVDSGGDPGGELMFHTDDYVGLRCADSGALSLAVKPSGNVGIGTTAPAVALDVIGTGSFAGAATSQSQGNVQVGVDSGGDPGGELMFHTDDYVGLRCADSGALPFAVKPSGNVGIGDVAPGTQLQVSGTAPYVTLKNSTAENTAGGCESKIIFEDHADVALAQVEGSHSGSSDDTKGKMILSTHTGSALTAALTINDEQEATFASDVVVTGVLDVLGGSIAFGNSEDVEIDFDATAHNVAGKSISILAGTTTAGTTSDIAGGSVTIAAGQGKGTGAGGNIVFKTANAAGSTGSSLNALATALTISDDLSSTFAGDVAVAGEIEAGSGSGAGVFLSNGNQDVTLKTGNSSTGSITITDGADEDITIAPNGDGITVVSSGLTCNALTVSSVDKTVNYECDIDFLIIASRSVTISLPEDADRGTIYKIKRVDDGTSDGTITVGRSGSDTIDGATSYSLDANYMMVEVMSDGSNWFVTGAYEVPE